MEYSDMVGNCEEAGWRITDEEDVRLKLESHKPLAYYFQKFLEGSLNWSRLCPGIKTTLYTPIQREWKDGIIIDVRGPVYGVSVFWPYDDIEVLSSALRSDAIVDWKNLPKMFFGISKALYEPIEETIKGLGNKVTNSYELQTYFMDQETARNLALDVPDDITIKRLDPSHAYRVNSTWRAARQGSIKVIENMITINHSVGLFMENDPEPISWVLESFYGLGSLYTEEKHRLKGYGIVCITALAKILGDEGKNVTAMVRDWNSSAHKLFKKVGFQPSGVLRVIQMCEDAER